MNIKHGILLLFIGSLAVSGCKTDSEEDILGGETGGGSVPADVVINEVCGKQDPDDDWVEFYNKGTEDEDLSGATLVKTDEDGKTEDIYTFPSGSKIKAGGYLVVATLTGELQAGISNSKEVGLTLVASDGTVVDKFDRDSDVGKDVSHPSGGSYARIPDGTGSWQVTTSATRGTSNSAGGTVEQKAKVVLNEICGLQTPDDDWIELFNAGTADADISGAKIVKTDEKGKTKDIYTFPDGTVIKAGKYLVVATLTGELQAGISNSKEVGIAIEAADGTVLDSFDRDVNIGKDVAHPADGSYARIPDGTGKWQVTTTCTRGTGNK